MPTSILHCIISGLLLYNKNWLLTRKNILMKPYLPLKRMRQDYHNQQEREVAEINSKLLELEPNLQAIFLTGVAAFTYR
jgi:hypothetical protein